MKRIWKKKDGVSPVIATILMVAITVVLAAVLYVMVIGMGDTGTVEEPLGLSSAGRTTTSFTMLVASAPDGAMVEGTLFSFTHNNAVTPVTSAIVYTAAGIPAGWWNGTWAYSGYTADTLEYSAGMKITITAPAVSNGDVLTISSSEEYFSTTTYTI